MSSSLLLTTTTPSSSQMVNLDELICNSNTQQEDLSDDLKFLLQKIDKEAFLKKLRHSIEVIKTAIKLSTPSNEDLCISFNGGKDCCVVLYLFYVIAKQEGFFSTKSNQRKFNILIMNLNEQFKELDDFVGNLFQSYYTNVSLIVLKKPQMKLKQCLEVFKEDYSHMLYILMGTRRTDNAYVEKLGDFAATDNGWPHLVRVNPIIDWTYSEIWYFIKRFNVPYCSLYDEGYTSLGDKANTVPNKALFDPQLGVYKPAFMLDNECNERNSRAVSNL